MMKLDTHTPPSPNARRSQGVIPGSVVSAMEAALPCSTREAIMDKFGISANTWQKLRNGAPIRASTAERLLDRLRRQGILERAQG